MEFMRAFGNIVIIDLETAHTYRLEPVCIFGYSGWQLVNNEGDYEDIISSELGPSYAIRPAMKMACRRLREMRH